MQNEHPLRRCSLAKIHSAVWPVRPLCSCRKTRPKLRKAAAPGPIDQGRPFARAWEQAQTQSVAHHVGKRARLARRSRRGNRLRRRSSGCGAGFLPSRRRRPLLHKSTAERRGSSAPAVPALHQLVRHSAPPERDGAFSRKALLVGAPVTVPARRRCRRSMRITDGSRPARQSSSGRTPAPRTYQVFLSCAPPVSPDTRQARGVRRTSVTLRL
jgi:hypothetical protein